MLTEEEKNRNNIILDGYHSLFDRKRQWKEKLMKLIKRFEFFCKSQNRTQKGYVNKLGPA